MEGCKSYLPISSIICHYFPVFPGKCHWHGKYAFLPAFCQPWSLGPSTFPDVPAFEIGTAGVKKLLRGLKPHKASGPDNIPTRFLKEAANELAPALCLILTASLNQGYVPDDWKTADVTPIFKKGDRSTPANYRPISLTAVCCKVMEHILHSQVMKHLDLHNILSDNQHHTGQCKRTGGCYNELVVAFYSTGGGVKGKKIYTC